MRGGLGAGRTSALAAAAGGFLLAAAPCLAQVTAGIRPPDAEGARHGSVTIAVVVDLRGTGKLLGSYGATLDWDASRLQYLSDTGGGPAFDAAVVNRDGAASGRLAFADAYAPGAAGLVNVFNVTFLVNADPLATAAIDLEFTSLYAAATYEDLLPGLTAQDGIVRSTHFDLGLAPTDAGGTLFTWNAIPGAAGYDLVRGDLGMISDDGSTVDLGGVVCVEDDSADTTTAAGTEPASPDTAAPATGAGFFYLVRFNDGASNRTYGFSYQAGRPRQPGPGDCP